jgi:hypothetical protein
MEAGEEHPKDCHLAASQNAMRLFVLSLEGKSKIINY